MQTATLDALRRSVLKLERPAARPGRTLGFGVPALDSCLPEGGLASGALHEVAGGGPDAVPAAAAALFAAGILARTQRSILWCTASQDLFIPGLARAGLHPDRIIIARAADDQAVLAVMEEALRHPGLSAVLGELTRLEMTASRRLVLAAERSGVMALALRRRREGRQEETGLTAAATRWRVTPLPSVSLPRLSQPRLGQGRAPQVAGIGRACWQVELTRCRGAAPQSWIMEACDAQGRLALSAALADGSSAQERPAVQEWPAAQERSPARARPAAGGLRAA